MLRCHEANTCGGSSEKAGVECLYIFKALYDTADAEPGVPGSQKRASSFTIVDFPTFCQRFSLRRLLRCFRCLRSAAYAQSVSQCISDRVIPMLFGNAGKQANSGSQSQIARQGSCSSIGKSITNQIPRQRSWHATQLIMRGGAKRWGQCEEGLVVVQGNVRKAQEMVVLAAVCCRYRTLAIAVDAKPLEAFILVEDVMTRRHCFSRWRDGIPRSSHFVYKLDAERDVPSL